MKNKPEPTDSRLSETMAARIEIKELGDPAHQKKITDAVAALDGVIETKIEKGALHVSYDPLATTEKTIEQAIRSTGTTIKAAAIDTEDAHPDLPTSGENSLTTAEKRYQTQSGNDAFRLLCMVSSRRRAESNIRRAWSSSRSQPSRERAPCSSSPKAG
jgi:copper chaperone CopZ